MLKPLLNKVAGRKEEHLRTAASQVTLGRDCLVLSFWKVAFKTILTYEYYKNTSCFQNRYHFNLNLIRRLYFESRFPMFIINGNINLGIVL